MIKKNTSSEHSNEKKPKQVRLKQTIYFFSLILFAGVFLFFMSKVLKPEQWNWYWTLTVTYFLPPAGKESVIFIGLHNDIPAHLWGLTLWVYDLLVCLGILTNWWILEFFIDRIPAFPFIGIRRKKPRIYRKQVSLKSWYEGLHRKTRALELKKYGKLLPVALFIFMFIPFQGTGAMSTTIIGTWLGFRFRETVTIVAICSALSILLIIFISYGLLQII
jgi:uncharacterized membrane protein